MVTACDACADMFHVLQEKVCRIKKKEGFSTVLWIYGCGNRKKKKSVVLIFLFWKESAYGEYI